MQIMLYTDVGAEVLYKRDPQVRWAKSAQYVEVRGMRVLIPAITLLFKAHQAQRAPQDNHDLRLLIEGCSLLQEGVA